MRTIFPTASVLGTIISGLLLCTASCGPTFFSSKGAISSSGGELRQWSASPVMCMREEFDGDSSKLIEMQFGLPKNTDPDRGIHGNNLPEGPYELHIAKNGSGYMAQMKFFKSVPGVDVFNGLVLDSSNCKTINLDRIEHAAYGSLHPTLNGELTMDCTYKQSHVTADIKFKKCGI